ncbi:MAG: 7-carboxy-7-deazaguanine synthase QueE [Richelia sp. RM2_1_2]|nr:7-carboxy-7-deazaguanine synthase QueE [Richelia sp. RM2_1_2]
MSDKVKKYRYSEIFGSTIQGEGHHTGIPTVWIRFFGCNFECQGFSQKNPRDPSTWINEYENIDLSNVNKMEDVPILKFGCDSAYSWSKKFAHLAHQETAAEICNKIENAISNEHNPQGKFCHPKTNQWIHIAFTGGEPMMQQSAIVDIMEEFERRNNIPIYVTVETNGTQPIRDTFANMITRFYTTSEFGGMADDALGAPEWFWSCSPKLSTSGEKWENAIKPTILAEYNNLSKHGQLKFVVDGSDNAWNEVASAVAIYRYVDVNWPVWIMPVGSSGAQQESIQAYICEESFRRGYNFSARVHSWIFNNAIGK